MQLDMTELHKLKNIHFYDPKIRLELMRLYNDHFFFNHKCDYHEVVLWAGLKLTRAIQEGGDINQVKEDIEKLIRNLPTK